MYNNTEYLTTLSNINISFSECWIDESLINHRSPSAVKYCNTASNKRVIEHNYYLIKAQLTDTVDRFGPHHSIFNCGLVHRLCSHKPWHDLFHLGNCWHEMGHLDSIRKTNATHTHTHIHNPLPKDGASW